MSGVERTGESTADQSALVPERVRRIVDSLNPRRVVLFGSRARGHARTDSDFDLLVVADSQEPRHRRSAPLYTFLADLPAEVEVVVYTPEEVQEAREVPQSFVSTALREGRVVYERQG